MFFPAELCCFLWCSQSSTHPAFLSSLHMRPSSMCCCPLSAGWCCPIENALAAMHTTSDDRRGTALVDEEKQMWALNSTVPDLADSGPWTKCPFKLTITAGVDISPHSTSWTRTQTNLTCLGAAPSISIQFESISTITLHSSTPWQISAVLHTAPISVLTLQQHCREEIKLLVNITLRQSTEHVQVRNSVVFFGQHQVWSTWVTEPAVVLWRTQTQEVFPLHGAHASIQTGVGDTGVQIYNKQKRQFYKPVEGTTNAWELLICDWLHIKKPHQGENFHRMKRLF